MPLDAGAPQKTYRWDDPLDLSSRLSEEERMVWDAARQYAAHRTWQGSLQPLFKTWRDTVAATGRRTARMPVPSIRES